MNKAKLVVILCVAALFEAQSATLYWKGASASANSAANWCSDAGLTVAAGAKPVDGDDIILGAGAGNMTWDLNDVTPGSWTQTADYAGTVTFYTGRKNGMTTTLYGVTDDNGETRVFRVSGNCSLLGGTWTHPGQPTFGKSTDANRSTVAYSHGYGVYHIIAEVGGNMSVGAAFTATASGKSFDTDSNRGQGPGAGSSNCSASHAGWGGRSDGTLQAPYGTFRNPKTIGSSHKTRGGGCIEIAVSGALSLESGSSFSADGIETSYYSGAGGSISIVAGSISGASSFSARGGNVTNGSYGGGGGGGRISIILTGEGADFSNFTGTYSTHNTPGTVVGKQDGFGGTTYLETAAQGVGGGTLIVDGGRRGYYNRIISRGTPISAADEAFRLSKIILRDNASLTIAGGSFYLASATVETNNVLLASAAAANTIYFNAVDIELAPNMTLSDWHLHTTAGSTLRAGPSGNGTLTVSNNGKLYVNGSTSLLGSLVVASAGSVNHMTGGSSESYKLDLSVSGNVTVQTGGTISATGAGYNKNTGPGANSSNNVGMHGGRVSGALATKHCYGSITRPVNYGSGGGANNTSNGGGAIKLTVAGNLVNNGSVEANGLLAQDYYPGAGGSVWVTASTISGDGKFTANGGLAKKSAAGGGMGSGGRVSLWLTSPGADFSSFTGYASALGGQMLSGSTPDGKGGAPGTVYFKTGEQAYNEGLLVITNNIPSSYVTEIVANSTDAMPIDVTDTDVGTVYIGNNGKLKVLNATLTVSGSWTNAAGSAAFTAVEGSEVVFTNASIVSNIKGQNTFSTLTCTTPGKTLKFGTEGTDVASIGENGTFTIEGASGNPVVLRGDVENTPWALNVAASARMNVSFVDVAYSDASAGTTVVASDAGASESQNNVNWQFVSIVANETNEWTGANSSYWTDAANWSLSRAPVDTDVVIVHNAGASPVFTGSQTFNVLEVREGATVSLAGYNLEVTNALSVAGTIACTGLETIEVTGNAALAANSFTCGRSTFVISGDSDQSVNLGGCTFCNLAVRKNGGSVAFAGGFDVSSTLYLEATAPSTVTFPQGAAVACFALQVDGGTGALSLTGPAWTLAVLGSYRVYGAQVGGCAATVGTIIARGGSTDLGGNTNWVFSDAYASWVGGSGSFDDPSHWSGNAVPGPGDHVLIDAAATVTATGPVSVKSLEVGGPAGTASFVARGGLDVGENLVVASNGVLYLDSPAAVTNSAIVYAAGKITHSANGSTAAYKVDLDCGNVFYLEEGGFVDVGAKGYSYGNGPAPGSSYPENHAASHGGFGCGHVNHRDTGYHAPCYGSFFAPVALGSGGMYDKASGGGAVRIFAGGEIRIDGTVSADAQSGTTYYTGAGGSVYLKGASFTGTGKISANGGNVNTDCAGGGGRIAIYETVARDWSLWRGTTTAYGGIVISALMDGAPRGSAGTIYFENAADGAFGGTVSSSNRGGFSVGFELPASVSSGDSVRSFRRTKFALGSGTRMRVTTDLRVNDISLDASSSGIVNTNWALGIYSKLHKDRAGWLGSVTTSPEGRVYWVPSGLSLMVR